MKHALYEITKNIPPPAIHLKSRTNGIAHLVRQMKRGDSALILTKQINAARNAAQKQGVKLVWQRVGGGKTARIWNVGKQEGTKPTVATPAESTDKVVLTKAGVARRPWTKRSNYWGPEFAALRRAKAAKGAAARAANKAATAQALHTKRKYTRRHASLSAKVPRSAGAPLFSGPEQA